MLTLRGTIPPENRGIVQEAYAGLWDYPMTQPSLAKPKGVAARRGQWRRVAGSRAAKGGSIWRLVVGFFGGLALGWFVGALTPPLDIEGVPPTLGELPTLAVFGAALMAMTGGYVGHQLGGQSGYSSGMMLVIANERRSRKRKALVTAQAECWVPKALVAHRAHDFSYANGQPYLWVMLPFGKRIQDVLHQTLDYLELQPDPYHAIDDAVYSQRSWNRMISDNALLHADADDDEEEDSKLSELLPYVVAAAFLIGGFLMVLLTIP